MESLLGEELALEFGAVIDLGGEVGGRDDFSLFWLNRSFRILEIIRDRFKYSSTFGSWA